MSQVTILEDLFRHNRWANQKLFTLAEGLRDEQLDAPREIGFGTLRNTLFHILAAEEIWLERWLGASPRPLPLDAAGLSLVEIAVRSAAVDQKRRRLLQQERDTGFSRICSYWDSKGTPYQHELGELLLHVANHGIHHRSQALQYLKPFDRKAPGGLDYLFFRLAFPHLRQSGEAAKNLRGFGLEIETGESPAVQWDRRVVERYYRYNDWANQRLVEIAAPLGGDALDRDFNMGMGTIRKTILHIYDAERFWVNNWTVGQTNFERSPPAMAIAEAVELWRDVVSRRRAFLEEQSASAEEAIQTVSFGGPAICLPRMESMLQVCGHGTHHRAQLSNMLRRSAVAPPALDYIFWMRQRGAS